MMANYYVGLDVGGTTMKAGVVGDDGRPLGFAQLPTEPERGQQAGLERMAEAIRAAVSAAKLTLNQIKAIGVATPGTMDIRAGIILDPPNLKPWRNVPVRQYVADTFRLPTSFQNDANAAALGEFWVGAGQAVSSFAFFTLGTGVGGGIVLDGKVIEGAHSHGAELGHTRIEMTNPRLCGCGQRGCLEAYASATAVVTRTREALAGGAKSALSAAAKLSARAIFAAAAEGDALALSIVDDTARYLALGAVNVMHTINPEMVAFGGGMVAAGEPFIAKIRAYVQQLAFPVPAAHTLIRAAQLGSDAGFIGAAAGARDLVKS